MMKNLLILLLIASFCSAQVQNKPYQRSKDGVTVLTYNFQQLEQRLRQNNDSVYVINFWATWCAPCVKELPGFEALGGKYKGRKVKVLLVSLDMNKQVESGLLPFIRKKKLQSEVVHLYEPDANGWIPKVDKDWSGALPATLIYRNDKRKFYERSFTSEELENEVKQFIMN